jgi:hypothetical protein
VQELPLLKDSESEYDLVALFPLLNGGSHTELFRVHPFVRSSVHVYEQSHWMIQ